MRKFFEDAFVTTVTRFAFTPSSSWGQSPTSSVPA